MNCVFQILKSNNFSIDAGRYISIDAGRTRSVLG